MEQYSAEWLDPRSFFQSVMFVYQCYQRGISPNNDDQGNRLLEKEVILDDWRQLFSELLNQPGMATTNVLKLELPQEEFMRALESQPTIGEFKSALDLLANNKEPELDCILAKVPKAGGASFFPFGRWTEYPKK